MNRQFLNWIADRIVNVYGESEHVDFVTKLRGIADSDSKAITALSGMVKALGSGVQASSTEQAGALTEACACIEAGLLVKRPEPELVHDTKAGVEPVPAVQIFGWPEAGGTLANYVVNNKGAAVRVTFTDENRGAESGTLCGVGSTYFWLVEYQKSDFTRYRDSIDFADVESIARDRKAEPIIWDNEPVAADRSVGDVANDWPGGGVTLADYVERNKGNRVRIEFEDNSELDRVGTIERIGSIMYFWVLDDQGKHGGRFSVAFCDVHTITRIPNRAVNPATMLPYTEEEPAVLPDSWEKDDAARAAVDEIEKCARASIGVRVAIKFSDEKAGGVIGTIRAVTHSRYVCVEDGANGTFMLNEIESIEPLAITDSWPGGGVSLNSYLNDRAGALVTVNYGAGSDVTGEIFRNPLRPGQYRLLLRTGSAELFMSDVVSVSCDK